MKRIFTSSLLFFTLVIIGNAQDRVYKIPKKSGTLKINVSNVEVEGYDGSEIIFSAPALKDETEDERAAGLKLITGSGLTDNTGLGLSVEDKNSIVDVSYVSKTNRLPLKIKVPNSLSLVMTTNDVMNGKSITVKDFKGELEVSVMYNEVMLENITGPVNAKTIYGSLTAKFDKIIKGPVSLVSIYKFVDVAIPPTLKANVNLSTQYGNIYAADGLNIKRELPAKRNEDGEDITGLTDWSRSTDIKGALNGGGIDFIIKSSHGKIYLREE